jgi:hypothetical protein
MKEQLIKLTDRLNKIAKKNKDSFMHELVFLSSKTYGFVWCFACKEDCEDHCFVSGHGKSPEEAMQEAENSIEAALEMWGYSE